MEKVDKIKSTNGFRALAALRKVALDPRVDEIEGEGMDEGRVFVHFYSGWIHESDGTHSFSAGSAAELRDEMTSMIKCTGKCCSNLS